MQKIVYVEDGKLRNVNEMLENGWKVVSVTHCAAGGGDSYAKLGYAFVVLEK